ncbi:T9SS type A sorting domain-containing protein [bacterium]|nr:T9SS type A sorting domain-containing protein [bacterium]
MLSVRNLFFLLVFTTEIFAQVNSGADSLVLFVAGNGASFGQNFLPNNVLGFPDTLATSFVPSANENQILSLGANGQIILGFFNNPIIDGNGFDFTVFENVFYVFGDTTDPFRETAVVSVSKDGLFFFDFPYNPQTLAGLAGLNPTNGNQNPQNFLVSGGDSFDLQTVGLDTAYFVKLTDTGNLVIDGSDNFSGGDFDLDAIVGINFAGSPSKTTETTNLKNSFVISNVFPNPTNAQVNFTFSGEETFGKVKIFNLLGKTIFEQTMLLNKQFSWKIQENIASGIYVLQVQSKNEVVSKKFTILK